MMKKFLSHLVIFIAVATCMNFILNKILPVSGDSRYDERLTHFTENLTGINTLFFGSSRTLRHIIPTEFDSVNKTQGIYTHSFNLGTPANKSLESYEQYEQFLDNYSKSKTKKIQNAFLEIYPLDGVSKKNMTTRKGYYWLNWDNLKFIYAYFKFKNPHLPSRLQLYSSYGFAYLINNFGFNYLMIEEPDQDKSLFNGLNNDGYLSLRKEIELTKSSDRRVELVTMHKKFERDTSLLRKRSSKVVHQFERL